MTLKSRVQNDMREALKAGDRERLKVLRMLLAAIKQIEIDERRDVDDTRVTSVLEKMVKQRRDSVRQFREGGRGDLADLERAEIAVLEQYLPEPLSEEELGTLIDRVIAECGAESIRDMGKVMGRLKPQVQGRADMSAVGARVKERLG
jgi:uncharacterized protein